MSAPDWRRFPSSEALAEALAGEVADVLAEAVARRGTGFIAVSGGTTPRRFFRALSQRRIDWSRVVVTLVDERFVPESSPRSNATLVKSTLLTNEAEKTRFEGLHRPAPAVEQAAREAAASLAPLPWPLDAAVLGMGADGHTASFFADAENLDALLDMKGGDTVLAVKSKAAGEPRLTLALPVLLDARHVALHIEGEDKKRVLDEVLAAPDPGRHPIAAVFEHARSPIAVFWAPKEADIS